MTVADVEKRYLLCLLTLCCVRIKDEDWEERIRILEDARNLKKVAEFFLHPEKPVEADGCARCFFDRVSAPPQLSPEDAEERAMILEEASLLKKTAVDFLHPEHPVVTTDPTACGRNYFNRGGSDDDMDFEERAAVLEDAKMLKSLATDYLHPERPVVSSATTGARCYFDRASAPATEDDDDERSRIMDDLKALKQAATDYLHPELPVAVTDPAACARCYFDRASAYQEEQAEDRDAVLQDVLALKQLAGDYMHPEKPLQVDPLATTRCYFDRASAPEVESMEESDAKAALLEDCLKLKGLAEDYLHPEKPVISNGSTARCYFDRASAPEVEDEEDAEERAAVLRDVQALKQSAVDFLHPELPVALTDPTLSARCFFDRPSAPAQESMEEIEERESILEETAALKKLAVDYLHPELPVEASVGSRCYFDRASAPEQLSSEEADERAQILQDAMALKSTAVQYKHPELPVVSGPTVTARCYFDRPSAPVQESLEDIQEREQVLADAAALKKSAIDYLHPEAPVVSDPAATARCYFDRYSAEVGESKEDADEIARIIADAKALKRLAVDYMHPELPVKTSDPSATGRCFFDRPSTRLHDQMIHSFPPHEDDDHSDHHEHGDHFGMDEDFSFLNEVRDKLTNTSVNHSKISGDDEVESNLSRSPSSVMLFQEESIYD